MSKELKMEVFASKEPVKSVKLHVYEFHTSELYENKYRLIRSAVWKMRNVNACGVFEDGSYIYTTEKISEEIPNVKFRLTYLGEQELNVLDYKKVYSELIKHWITQKLRTVKIQKNSKEYYKYACKQDNISDTTKYEDHFVAENRLIAISKSGRSMDSEDVQNFLNATERGIDVQLFVRKNKDDKISKEFYYLGRVIATGNAKQFVMPNTDKMAVEIEWELETPVREDIYQYIVNE